MQIRYEVAMNLQEIWHKLSNIITNMLQLCNGFVTDLKCLFQGPCKFAMDLQWILQWIFCKIYYKSIASLQWIYNGTVANLSQIHCKIYKWLSSHHKKICNENKSDGCNQLQIHCKTEFAMYLQQIFPLQICNFCSDILVIHVSDCRWLCTKRVIYQFKVVRKLVPDLLHWEYYHSVVYCCICKATIFPFHPSWATKSIASI